MKIKTRSLINIFIITATLFIYGCNTVEGFGEDVEKGGKAIQKSSQKHQS